METSPQRVGRHTKKVSVGTVGPTVAAKGTPVVASARLARKACEGFGCRSPLADGVSVGSAWTAGGPSARRRRLPPGTLPPCVPFPRGAPY